MRSVAQLFQGARLFILESLEVFVQEIYVHTGVGKLLFPADNFDDVHKTFMLLREFSGLGQQFPAVGVMASFKKSGYTL